ILNLAKIQSKPNIFVPCEKPSKPRKKKGRKKIRLNTPETSELQKEADIVNLYDPEVGAGGKEEVKTLDFGERKKLVDDDNREEEEMKITKKGKDNSELMEVD